MLVFRARRFCTDACKKNSAVSDEPKCPISHMVCTGTSQNNWVRGKKKRAPAWRKTSHTTLISEEKPFCDQSWVTSRWAQRLERHIFVVCLSLCLWLYKCTRIGEKCLSFFQIPFQLCILPPGCLLLHPVRPHRSLHYVAWYLFTFGGHRLRLQVWEPVHNCKDSFLCYFFPPLPLL